MAAENSILQARIKGLENAVVIEKKRRHRGKPCIKNIRTINEGKAAFWSPQKLATTKQVIEDEETSKQQEAMEKAQAKVAKAKEKENQEKAVLQRRQEREKLQRQKQKDKEEVTQARLASLQLKNELQYAIQATPKQGRGSPSKKKVVINIESSNDEEVVETPKLRTRRKVNAPKWLDDYILE
jgi:ABC-type phosphate transport system auxiliary subunit